MKKYIILLILPLFIINCTNVNAEILGSPHGNVNVASKTETSQIIINQADSKAKAEYVENEIKKYLSNQGKLKWADDYIDLVMSDIDLNLTVNKDSFIEDGFGTTDKEIRKNLTDYMKIADSNLLYSFIPAELAVSGVNIYGGSAGSPYCTMDGVRGDCMYEHTNHWYPVILDEVINIQKNDANGQKIYFNYITEGKDKYKNTRIIDNGNVDDSGAYISLNKLQLTNSEYKNIMNNNGKLKLFISGSSPYAFDYFELKTNGVYKPIYITNHAYNRSGIEVDLKDGSAITFKKFTTIEIDKTYFENNSINGIFIMQQGNPKKYGSENTIVTLNNPNLDEAINNSGSSGLAYYYRFKIKFEIIDEAGNVTEPTNTNNDKDIKDNNAKILIDDKVVNISNKKSWSEGRIYVALNDLCKEINCNYEYNSEENQYKVDLYPVKGENNIVYSMLLSDGNSSFESLLKVYDEVYKFKNKIMDASPYLDDDKIYVPIRFVLEGLGAQVDYYPTNGSQPEEVHIKLDVDTFVETLINDKKIEENSIEADNTTLEIRQYYLQVDGSKRSMEKIQVLTSNNELKICETSDTECDIIIKENRIVFQNPNIKETLKVYIIGKYSDYPYIKSIDIKS